MFSLVKSRLREDDGVALIIALSVMMVAIALSLLVVQVAVSTNTDSGVDRQRAVSVNAAEAGLDAEFIQLQTTQPSHLPCPGALSPLTIAVPDNPSVTRTISYTDMQNNAVTDCNALQAMSLHNSVRAVITSTANPVALAGVTRKRTRVMQATVTLSPVLGNGFQNAIFANSQLTVNNNHTVYGNQGDDANIYSNGNISCPTGSQQTYHGNLLAQGYVDFEGQCSVSGDLWAKDYVVVGHNQSTVGGRAISSTSSVALANVSNIAGNVMAGTTITPSSCVSPKCTRGLVQAAPPTQPFPNIDEYNATLFSQWTTATTANPPGLGYTAVQDNNCATIMDDLQGYAHDSQGRNMLVQTTCAISFSGSNSNPKNLALYNNLVIFSDRGFTSSNQVNMVSGDGQAHNLYWIVPFDTPISCTSATPPNITTDNQFSIDSKTDVMLYTPCNINVSNHSTQFGQVYGGGTVNVNNNFDMDFRPLPVVGIDPLTEPTLSYNVDITYKREVRG